MAEWIPYARRGTAILLAGLLIGFIAFLHLWNPAPLVGEAGLYPYRSVESCRKCHQEIYDEWLNSFHARSWKDPLVQAVSKGFGSVDCIPCHAPEPLLLAQSLSSPMARAADREQGVNCLSCHRVKQGVAVGYAASKAPCQPVMDQRIGSTVLCRACHNLHGTVDDWQATGLQAQGQDCRFCHMPRVKRKEGEPSRYHGWEGGHSVNMVRRAIAMSARKEGNRLVVEVTNAGAGHNVPTELRHRALDLEVTVRQGWFHRNTHTYRFRNPYKEKNEPNTQLQFRECRRLSFPLPPGKGTAEVSLLYRLMPYGQGSKGVIIRKLSIPFHGVSQNQDG